MPSLRVFSLLALSTLLGVVGVVVPRLAAVALGLDALILMAFGFDAWRLRQVPLRALRQWPPLLVQGAEGEVTLVLSNHGPRTLRVRLRETLHPGLATAPCRAECELAPHLELDFKYKITPRQRGNHFAGPLLVRVLGPWGLAWRQRQLIAGEDRRVYPQVRWQGQVGRLLLLADRHALGQQPRQLAGMGNEPYALREYLPGDPPRKIHWKATARHGHPITREETWERGARLLILLDCARSMSGMDGERSKLDHALAAALALTRVAVARGDRVTLVAFSDHIERTVRIQRGQRGLAMAYGQLYDLVARYTEPAFDLVAQTAIQLEARRSTAVLLTSIVDLASAELLRQAILELERRHRPILVNLQDPELVALAMDAPRTVEYAFAKVQALELLLANRRLGTRLRHAGVRVVATAADQLAAETLAAYLELFQTQAGRASRVRRAARGGS